MSGRPVSHRSFDANDLIVASHNQGKVREIRDLLVGKVDNVVSAGELDLPEPDETGTTFIANAELKALAAAKAAGKPALADDSGLCVVALDGDPGIYSARWAGPDKDFGLAMQKVEDALQAKGATGTEQRAAFFVCALTLAWPDGHVESFEGKVHGHMTWPPRGGKGFGYDPVFVPNGHEISFAEMDPVDKHAMSHRADAFRQLVAACF